jgi:TonB family protein
MKRNNLLLRTFFLSLSVHIVGLSLFSITLPKSSSSKKPIEITLLPPVMDKKSVELARTEIIPEIPEIERDYREFLVKKRKILQFSIDDFTGSPEYIPFTIITKDFEIPEFHVEFPQIAFIQKGDTVIKKLEMDIEGPVGKRELLYKPDAEYPEWAEKAGAEGNVKLKFWVEPDGKITETEIIHSSGYPRLDIFAQENIRRWIFNAVAGNEKAWGIITFRFRLR